MRIGIAGYGYFGRILSNALDEIGNPAVLIADPAYAGLEGCERVVPSIDEHLQYLDAVVIATPPADHIDTIIKALNADTHVFCEKPLVVPDPTKATHTIGLLMHEAKDRSLVVHVDHTLVYCSKRVSAVANACQHVVAVREGDNLNKHGLSVVWDLLIHEVAVAVFVNADRRPDSIIVNPVDLTRDRVEVVLKWGDVEYQFCCENGSVRRRDLYVDSVAIDSTDDPIIEDVQPVTRSLSEFIRAVTDHRTSATGLGHALVVAGVLEDVEKELADQVGV